MRDRREAPRPSCDVDLAQPGPTALDDEQLPGVAAPEQGPDRHHRRALDLIDHDLDIDAEAVAKAQPLLARGLLERNGAQLKLSPASLTVSNEVFVALLD